MSSVVIYRFTLEVADGVQRVSVPGGAENSVVRSVGQTRNHDTIDVWIEIDPQLPKEDVAFVVHGTGHKILAAVDKQYVGTVIDQGLQLVWHIYQVPV